MEKLSSQPRVPPPAPAGKGKAVQFPFNLKDDRVANVAQEMVHELKLNAADLSDLTTEIMNAIKRTVGEDWVEGTVPVVDEGAQSGGARTLSAPQRKTLRVFQFSRSWRWSLAPQAQCETLPLRLTVRAQSPF